MAYPYTSTPYSGYNTLPAPFYDTPGMGMPGLSRSATYYVAPSISGRARSRSHSRPRRSHSHHRSRSHHGHHHGHRRSHSTTPRYRTSANQGAYRYQTSATTSPRSNYYRASPSLGERILSFFGLGNSSRYVDQHGRPIDSRGRPSGRPKYK